MLVRQIDMCGFMLHTNSTIELPESGVVLITGPNGEGKSSIIEAVATAAWGKTLRGTNPWNGKGKVSLLTCDHTIERTHSKGGHKRLSWEPVEGSDTRFESPTKAQEALEACIGSFDVWRRTSVFSSHDAAHFTMSTDAQRKRLLEQLLGMERFDSALTVCRSDRKDTEARCRETTRLLGQLESQLTGTRERVEYSHKVLATLPAAVDTKELEATDLKLRRMISEAQAEMDAVCKQVKDLELSTRDLYAEAKTLRARLSRLGEGDCDNCGQPIPESLRDDLRDKVGAADFMLKEQERFVQQEIRSQTDQISDLSEEGEALRLRRANVFGQIQVARNSETQRAAAQEAVSKAEEAVATLEDRIGKASAEVQEVSDLLAILKATEQVLGVRGVRAHIMGRALSGLEQAANAWLSRICDNMRLELKSYSEKKMGGISDMISLEVHGAGNGHGYRAASGGQRRRIDVALLLALSDVAHAAHGTSRGTIWVDECFDALDESGVERVVSVFSDLAKDRPVVVISHNPQLKQSLTPAACYVVREGSVERTR